jgi:outer membrane protein
MKRLVLISFLLISFVSLGYAQKFAYVDTEYILGNIPSYKAAQEQLDKLSQQYQKELETLHTELDKMYKDFQAEAVLLSDDMKRRREDVIVTKEKEYKKLQRQYFGPEGDLYRKRQSLIKPIQDDVFKAIQDIADQGAYSVIFDKAGGLSLIYSNPKYDLSDQVLQKLGYKK